MLWRVYLKKIKWNLMIIIDSRRMKNLIKRIEKEYWNGCVEIESIV